MEKQNYFRGWAFETGDTVFITQADFPQMIPYVGTTTKVESRVKYHASSINWYRLENNKYEWPEYWLNPVVEFTLAENEFDNVFG